MKSHNPKEHIFTSEDTFDYQQNLKENFVQVVVHSELPYAPASRFQPGKVKDIINKMLKERLGSLAAYDFEQAPAIAREIADSIKYQIRGCSSHSLPHCSHSLINEN